MVAGGTGDGSSGAPFGRIQHALNAARAGDTITVAPGTYAELLTTVRSGVDGAPITISASEGTGSVIVTRVGRLLTASHAYIVVDGIVFDGQYGASDAIKIASTADYFVLRRSEVRRSGRDCVDMGGPDGVLIEQSAIHHCLWWDGRREDAHGIVAGSVRDLTLRGVEVHTFSGDGFQLDPSRSLPGWDRVTIEDSSFWLAPLPTSQNGFAAGSVPGENAVDTKTNGDAPRAQLTIRNTTARGFGPGLITNMAAFNLKERIDVTVDRVTVSRSEIAFRVRGPGSNGGAWVDIRNAVIHDVSYGVRYEDDIESLEVSYTTFGERVGRAFRAASSGQSGLDVRNTLVLGTTLPVEAPAASRNLVVASSAFVSAGANDYRLAAGSSAIDHAVPLTDVATDRAGVSRPQGPAPDVGAFERLAAAEPPVLTAARSATDPTNAVRLSWVDRHTGETAYEVERSSDGVTFSRIKTLSANSTRYTNSKLTSGRTYWFRVRALMGTSPTPYTNVASVTLDPEVAPPAAPSGLAVRRSNTRPTSALVLSWTDTSLNEDGFEIQRSTDGISFSRITTRDPNETSYVNSGLTSARTYWYRIRSSNSLGKSAHTPVVSVRTQ